MGASERSFGPVRFLPGKNRARYPHCHSLYIEGAGVLIDPACDRQRLKRLRDEEGVSQVWLSHWHEDHLRHLDLFDDLPLYMSEADAPPLSDLEAYLDWNCGDNQALRDKWRDLAVRVFNFRPRRPTGFLCHGQVVELGPLSVEVIATPGHTPGSLCFFFRQPRVLFLADYDLTSFGPWYGDIQADIDELKASVARLHAVPARTWLAGHGEGVYEEDPGERWDNFVGVIDNRERRLLEFLEQPRTLDEIVGAWIAYGHPRQPEDFYRAAEEGLMRKHLKALETRGMVAWRGRRVRRV